MTTLREHLEIWRIQNPNGGQYPAAWLAELDALEAENAALRERCERMSGDIAAAACELLIAAPVPGSIEARLLCANVLMRKERDEARAALARARDDRDEAGSELLFIRELLTEAGVEPVPQDFGDCENRTAAQVELLRQMWVSEKERAERAAARVLSKATVETIREWARGIILLDDDEATLAELNEKYGDHS